MSKISFNVDANMARLIGRQNVAKLDSAIMELIKNAYDADATHCFLYYEGSSNMLILADNGCGMDEETIIKSWMTIGHSSKIESHKTKKGRIQTGEKGIGRFALDRVGDECLMFTMTEKKKLLWRVKWDSFHFGKSITDVTADLDETEQSVKEFLKDIKNEYFIRQVFQSLKKTGSGTIFLINSLRDTWDETTITHICDMIKQLIPGDYAKFFNVYFYDETTHSKGEAQLITETDEIKYDYKISFSVEQNGGAQIELIRNEFDFKDRSEEIIKGCQFTEDDRRYFRGESKIIKTDFQKICDMPFNSVGAFNGILYFAKSSFTDVDKEIYFYRDNNINKIEETFGGVKLYRDGFRVRPYGEFGTAQYDWLQLSYRKNKSPASIAHPSGNWRVSANQIHGSIFISRENSALEDQSNREGIIESRAFVSFKEFIIYVIKEFESDRQYVGRKLNEYYKALHDVDEIEETIDKHLQGNKKSKNISLDPAKLKSAFDSKQEKIDFLEDENRLLRTLATTGILTNTYIHEIKGLNDQLGLKIVVALELLQSGKFDQGTQKVFEAQKLSSRFTPWFDVTIDAVRQDRRKMKKISLSECIKEVASSWTEALKSKGIEIDTSQIEDVEFRCFAYEIESILHNLIANSKASFDTYRVEKKKILIRLCSDEEKVYLYYSDNGKGLSQKYKSNPTVILEAFESDKRNGKGELIGTGMGMWIINKTVREYKGEIDLSANITADNGFYITIILSR